MLKVTAFRDVRIYANFVSFKTERVAEGVYGQRPVNTMTFANLRKGESRSDISLFMGIDPHYLPNDPTMLAGTNLWIVPYDPGKTSPAFQALVQVEEVKT